MSSEAQPALLALHTTEPVGSLAVAHAGGVRAVEFEAFGQHAPVVLVEISKLLQASALELVDLAAIAVTTGPGSFTGIRVGLATAQGLAAARGWRAFTCDSLAARAAACGRLAEPLAVVLDARRGEVFAALYDVTHPVPQTLVKPFCAAPGEAARRLARGALSGESSAGSIAPRRVALTGSGAALVGPHLDGFAALRPRLLGAAAMPVARALVELVRAGACCAVAPHELEPTYLRKSDAEVRRDSILESGT